jgi:hypothetical protein
MRLLIVLAGAVALTGCAANMVNPAKSLAEQKRDRRLCAADATGPAIRKCLAARGYVEAEIDPFPQEGSI